MIYPNGWVLYYLYNDSTVDTAISRISSEAEDDGTGNPGEHLEHYAYLGLSTIIDRHHPETNTDLTYLDPSSSFDEVTGLDRFGRVIDQNWINIDTGVSTDEFQYGYDQDGNVLYEENVLDPSQSYLYTYDSLNRLTGYEQGTLNDADTAIVGTPTSSVTYALDAVGNQSSTTTNGTTIDKTSNGQNELTSVGESGLTYDNDGNTTTDATGNTYIYNAWNQLISVKASGGTTLTSYTYDANGYRMTQTEGGVTTNLYYDNNWQVIEERQGGTATSNVTQQYLWSLANVDAMVLRDTYSSGAISQRLYAEQDANWNVTSLVDTSGTVVQRFTYDPYGNVTVLNATFGSATDGYNWIYMYQGGRFDAATGLYNFRNRDYNPSTGIWTEQEPLGGDYIDTMDLYQFADGDPVGNYDPTGFACVPNFGKKGNVAFGNGLGRVADHPGHIISQASRGAELGDGLGGPPGAIVGGVVGFGRGIGQAMSGSLDPVSLAVKPHSPKPLLVVRAPDPKIPNFPVAGDDNDDGFDGNSNPDDPDPNDPAYQQAQQDIKNDEDSDPFHDKKVHGNSLDSDAPAQGYILTDRDTGEPLAYGMTTLGTGRYSQQQLDQMNADQQFVADGSVREMREWETKQIQDYSASRGERPPLNQNDH